MARTTVRVDIPNTNPDDVITLIEAIMAQHNALNKAAPGSSPIAQKTMDALSAIVATAKPDRAAAKAAQAQADTLMSSSNNALGFGEGQTMRTEGTGLWLVGQIRDLLLANYRGQETNLEIFGFNVVISTAAIPQRQANAQKAKS